MKTLLFPVVIAVGIFGLAVSLLVGAWDAGPQDRYPLDKACYAVVAGDGTVYKSWFPPVLVADGPGVYSFNNDHSWGFVFSPSAMIADRDCLRERYADQPDLIPPLTGSDD